MICNFMNKDAQNWNKSLETLCSRRSPASLHKVFLVSIIVWAQALGCIQCCVGILGGTFK